MGSEIIRNAGWRQMQMLRYWRPFRRQLLSLLLLAAAVALLSVLFIHLQQPIFQSSSLLAVWQTGDADKPDHAAAGVIRSREVLTAAINRLAMTETISVEEFGKNLKVIPTAQGRLLTVAYYSNSAESARASVQAVTQSYIAHNQTLQSKRAEEAVTLLQQQMEAIIQGKYWFRDEEGSAGTDTKELSLSDKPSSAGLDWGHFPLTLVQTENDGLTVRSLIEEAGIRAAVAAYEARVSDSTSISVIDEAMLPAAPESRKVIGPFLSSYVLAFLLGTGFVLIRQRQSNRITQGDEAHVLLGYRLLGELPDTEHSGKEVSLNISDAGGKFFAEAVRNIRTQLCIQLASSRLPQKSAGEQDWQKQAARVILVTSTKHGEGKTTVATQLALALAQLSRVLLIDTVLRPGHAAASVFANLPARAAGLSHIIAGAAQLQDCIHSSQGAGLDLMPAGVLPPNPQELLANSRFGRVLFALSKRYDYIVMDAAALEQVADTLLLLKHCDHVIFTLKAGAISVKPAMQALQRLAEAVGTNRTDISLVVNRSRIQAIVKPADTSSYSILKKRGRSLANTTQ
ncbi:MAG: CpsD/CapB family tyrosine-protein kinase [Pseudomonadales bacterium]|nr:CpsD/CapB family tyrosine-protein kinase [Pseudomonadales bacterium]